MSWSIDMTDAPPNAVMRYGPKIGDIYAKAGGKPGFWLIIALQGETAHALAFDPNGICTGAQSYRASYFEENSHRRVGIATNIPERISIQWNPQ